MDQSWPSFVVPLPFDFLRDPVELSKCSGALSRLELKYHKWRSVLERKFRSASFWLPTVFLKCNALENHQAQCGNLQRKEETGENCPPPPPLQWKHFFLAENVAWIHPRTVALNAFCLWNCSRFVVASTTLCQNYRSACKLRKVGDPLFIVCIKTEGYNAGLWLLRGG